MLEISGVHSKNKHVRHFSKCLILCSTEKVVQSWKDSFGTWCKWWQNFGWTIPLTHQRFPWSMHKFSYWRQKLHF